MIAVALPMVVGIALAAHFDEIPERMPVHWNAIGVADRFWPKSIPLVFAHILAALGLMLVLHVYVPALRSIRHLDPRAMRKALTALSLSSSLLFSLRAAGPLVTILTPDLDLSWLTVFVAAQTVAIVVAIVLKIYAMPEP